MRFAYDYNQLYIYDAGEPVDFSGGANPYLDALYAATESGLTVGAASGIVDVLMPRHDNFSAPLEVTLAESAPPLHDTADHVVEFDLATSGCARLEGSGGSGQLELEVPPGRYRVRLSGFEFDEASEWSYGSEHPPDRYHLELWPSEIPAPPAELRRWRGYADRL